VGIYQNNFEAYSQRGKVRKQRHTIKVFAPYRHLSPDVYKVTDARNVILSVKVTAIFFVVVIDRLVRHHASNKNCCYRYAQSAYSVLGGL
jgi:hypothetical protein